METVTLTGRLLRADGETPEDGGVAIEPSSKIILAETAETLVIDEPVYYPLDLHGEFQAPLVPCQAPGTVPLDVHYILHYRTSSGSVEPLRFVVTNTKPVWDLSEVHKPAATNGYASVAAVHDLGLRVAGLEELHGGPGSGAQFVLYEHIQETVQATWTIHHGMGRDPVAVQVFDASGDVRDEYSIVITEPNQTVTLGYDVPISGKARLI